MPDTALKAYIAGTGVALLVVIGVGAVAGSAAVADDLRSRAERTLADAGLDGVDVDFSGREAELSGGSRADLAEARALVDGLEGVRSTRVAEGAASLPSRPERVVATVPHLVLRRTADGATISGVVPDADAQARIRAAAATAFGRVRGDLLVDPAVGRADWVDDLPAVVASLRAVEGLEVRIVDDRRLTLTGTLDSAAQRDRLVQQVSTAISDLAVVDRIDVPGNGGR